MNKEEVQKKFNDNVEWLKKNVPPDDIYLFAEQTKMAAAYFIRRWAEWVDLKEESGNDPIAQQWLTRISALVYMQDYKLDLPDPLDLGDL